MSLLTSCEQNEDILQHQSITFPITIALDKPELTPLNTIGGAVYYNEPTLNNGNDFIIVRVNQSTMLAVSSLCTHQGCQVNLPTPDKTTLFCPCHFAEFSSQTGAVTVQPKQGSATNLPVFDTEYNQIANVLVVYLPGND